MNIDISPSVADDCDIYPLETACTPARVALKVMKSLSKGRAPDDCTSYPRARTAPKAVLVCWVSRGVGTGVQEPTQQHASLVPKPSPIDAHLFPISVLRSIDV
jgi:hypothetical protein